MALKCSFSYIDGICIGNDDQLEGLVILILFKE